MAGRFTQGSGQKFDYGIHNLTDLLGNTQESDFISEWTISRLLCPRLKAMTWDMANQDAESVDPVAVINLKVSEEYLLHLNF